MSTRSETAIQMTLTELNENLREIYMEAYTHPGSLRIHPSGNGEGAVSDLRPLPSELTARDFYDMEIGSAGIMRGYMAHPCDGELTLEKKLRLFLTMSLRAYNVEGGKGAGHPVRGRAGYPHDLRTGDTGVVQGAGHALRVFPCGDHADSVNIETNTYCKGYSLASGSIRCNSLLLHALPMGDGTTREESEERR